MIKDSPMHIGGCIINRSPNDMHGDACDCFKIEFMAFVDSRSIHVQMCREWVAYMAQRVKMVSTHCKDRTSAVVKRAVEDALGVRDEWFRWHHFKGRRLGKKQEVIAGDFGALPMYFPEVVMDNRYARIVRMVPCNIAAEFDGRWSMSEHRAWTGWTKGYAVATRNMDEHRRFIKALERACCVSEACKLTGLDNRKTLVALTNLLKLKTEPNDTN